MDINRSCCCIDICDICFYEDMQNYKNKNGNFCFYLFFPWVMLGNFIVSFYFLNKYNSRKCEKMLRQP